MKKTVIARTFIAVTIAFWVVMFAYATATLMGGCATFKHVVRTVADVAETACQIFGTEHPEEFHFLVEERVPRLAEKPGFTVQEACAVIEVVQPFVDAQLALQNQTAMSLKVQMNLRKQEGENAVAPE
jgi:hypothetical protein